MIKNFILTQNQEKAMNHTKGRLRIIACPGSGKTEVIARRVSSLIRSGVKPSGIVAITFTEKAADELKKRIRAILETSAPDRADFGDMFIGTIHGFALDLLRDINPFYRSFDVLDEPKRVAFLSTGTHFYNGAKLRRLEVAHKLGHYQTISKFIKSADIVMMERINPEDLTDENFRKCFLDYLSTLKSEHYFDFSTIIYSLVQELEENPDRINLIKPRIRHLIIDEFQDVDKLQNDFLELLYPYTDSYCVVGDDDQGIYHWRGTDVSIMQNFCDNRGGSAVCTDISLDTNFRSTSAIVDLAGRFIEHNERRLKKEMEPSPELKRPYEDGDIQFGIFDKEEEELEYIVSRIRELYHSDFIDKTNKLFSLSYGDFAILTRTNEWAAKIIDRLDEERIPAISYSGESIFERPIVKFSMDCIAYIFECPRTQVESTPRIPDLDYLLTEYKRNFPEENFPLANIDYFERGITSLKSEIKPFIDKKKMGYLPGLGFQEIYHRILEALGAGKFEFSEVYNYNLAALSNAISDYESVWKRLTAYEVKYFFNFIGAYGKSVYTDPEHQDSTVLDAVRILTIHKAKGLEFPVIFVPDFVVRQHRKTRDNFVDDKLYPRERYIGQEDDERRVYYTAITRSEKYLFLSASKFLSNRKRERMAHHFIREMPQKYIVDPIPLHKSPSRHPSKLELTGTFSTSYSDLISYIRCPNDFLLRKIYGYNAGVPIGFGYGTNIHNALNVIHKEYLNSGKVPTRKEALEMLDEIFTLRYATDEITENMKKSARKVIQNYLEVQGKDMHRILETEKRFEFVQGEALIAGQIDLLKKSDDDGGVREVEIIDFKTEKKGGIYNADYERQLRYYAIACLESLNYKPEKATVHHLDVTEGDPYDHVDISDRYLTETREEVNYVVSKIISKDFQANPRKEKCEECDYRRLCSHKSVEP